MGVIRFFGHFERTTLVTERSARSLIVRGYDITEKIAFEPIKMHEMLGTEFSLKFKKAPPAFENAAGGPIITENLQRIHTD